jgi:hypothetical protein
MTDKTDKIGKTGEKPKSHDMWFTPPDIIETVRGWYGGQIDYDPASCKEANLIVQAKTISTINDTGTSAALTRPWGLGGTREGRVWCNPPYLGKGVVESWVRKANREFHASNDKLEILMLLNRSDANWYQDFVDTGLLGYYQFRNRIKFIDGSTGKRSSPRYNNDLLYWGFNYNREFYDLCELFGRPAPATRYS